MSESMTSHNEIEHDGSAVSPRSPLEAIVSAELSPSFVIEQFLSDCNDPSVEKGEPLAAFILAALSGSSSDERTAALRATRLSPSDDQFETLVASDDVFKVIFELLVKAKKLVGRGESMSQERKALIELIDLRAGEVLVAEAVTDEINDGQWREVLAKLFPDLA